MKTPLKHGLVIASLSSALLAGCMSTTKVSNPIEIITNDNYIVNIPDAEFVPSKAELMGGKMAVVVLPVKIDSNATFETGAVRQISSELESGLITAGADIVDRNLASKLGDEILAYEATGQFSGAGIDVADVAILPAIHNVDIAKRFSAARNWTDDDGDRHYTPPSCFYEATVSGNVKFFELPDLNETEALTFKGTASNTMSINNSSCPVSQDLAYSLASQASGNGVYNILPEIQQNFSQSGFVIEYRKRDNEHLVNINLGSNHKLKPGQKIKFARKVSRYNRLTEKTKISTLPYNFTGVVSDLIEPDNAWVIVDEEAETQLKYGDIAKTYFEQTIWDSMTKGGNIMDNLKNSFN